MAFNLDFGSTNKLMKTLMWYFMQSRMGKESQQRALERQRQYFTGMEQHGTATHGRTLERMREQNRLMKERAEQETVRKLHKEEAGEIRLDIDKKTEADPDSVKIETERLVNTLYEFDMRGEIKLNENAIKILQKIDRQPTPLETHQLTNALYEFDTREEITLNENAIKILNKIEDIHPLTTPEKLEKQPVSQEAKVQKLILYLVQEGVPSECAERIARGEDPKTVAKECGSARSQPVIQQ